MILIPKKVNGIKKKSIYIYIYTVYIFIWGNKAFLYIQIEHSPGMSHCR